MEVQDPVSVQEITLAEGKRRQVIRLRTRAECRALIAAVARASELLPDDGSGVLTALATARAAAQENGPDAGGWPPEADEPVFGGDEVIIAPEPGSRPYPEPDAVAAVAGSIANGAPLTVSDNGYPDAPGYVPSVTGAVVTAWLAADELSGRDAGPGPQSPRTAIEAMCPRRHPEAGECCRFAGHRMPHRGAGGVTWDDDAPRPAHHWNHGEDPCHGEDEDENNEIWLCTAQSGHDGLVHIVYGADGEPLRTWPVTYDTRMACGDTWAGICAYEPGMPLLCPRHGMTAAITEAAWLELETVEHETYGRDRAARGEPAVNWTPPATAAELAREWSRDSDSLQRQLGADLAAVGDNTPALYGLAREWEAEACKTAREIDRELAGEEPDDEDPWEQQMSDICIIYTRSAAQLRETIGGAS